MSEGEGEGEEHEHGPDVAQRMLEEGEIPPPQYLILHPESRLTPEEIQQLIDGFNKSLK